MSYDVLLHVYLNEKQVLGWVNCGNSPVKIWLIKSFPGEKDLDLSLPWSILYSLVQPVGNIE